MSILQGFQNSKGIEQSTRDILYTVSQWQFWFKNWSKLIPLSETKSITSGKWPIHLRKNKIMKTMKFILLVPNSQKGAHIQHLKCYFSFPVARARPKSKFHDYLSCNNDG